VRAGKGVAFRVVSGGGGFGAAVDRPADEVLRDVALGYVSIEGAARDYGVSIVEGPDGAFAVDAAETERRRGSMRKRRDGRLAAYRRTTRRALARAASGEVTAQARAEIAEVQALAARGRGSLAAGAEHPSGALDDPFGNARAMEYWDSDSLRRWMSRHGGRRKSRRRSPESALRRFERRPAEDPAHHRREMVKILARIGRIEGGLVPALAEGDAGVVVRA
jgi:hypothetical protein